MKQKKDIQKLITTGSARDRVVMLFYHYNLIEAIKTGLNIKEHGFTLPLTPEEADELFRSIKRDRDIDIYNKYRTLNKDVIGFYKWAFSLYKLVEVSYWKYQSFYYMGKYLRSGIKPTKEEREIAQNLNSGILEELKQNYKIAISYYKALQEYMKVNKYKDQFVQYSIRAIYEGLTTGWSYIVEENGESIFYNLSDIKADERLIKMYLVTDFNIEYEQKEKNILSY
jgi:hypothetical protein